MDTFGSLWDCSVENSIIGKDTQFTSQNVNDIAINANDKRFKLKSHTPEQILPKNSHQQQSLAQSNSDVLKLTNKKELKNKFLNFDINRNFEDIYWLSLKEKPTKSSASFPPIFDKNSFKPKHGMNSYQLIKFENRYQQQLLNQQQNQQQQPAANVKAKDGNVKKKYSVTDTISKTAAVLVDLNRQSLSSLHSMPIVNENFRNRYFENYLQNRKISIAQASNAENSKISTNNSNTKVKDLNNTTTNNNNAALNNSNGHNNNTPNNSNNGTNPNNNSGKTKNSNDNESYKDNYKNSDASSNKPNETNANPINTILFKANFNLADNGNSFDEEDDFNSKLLCSASLNNRFDPQDYQNSLQNGNPSTKPEYSIRRGNKKFSYKRTAPNPTTDPPNPVFNSDSKIIPTDDLQFQFRLKPLTETNMSVSNEDTTNNLNSNTNNSLNTTNNIDTPQLAHNSFTPTPNKRNGKRDSSTRHKPTIQESIESLSKKIAENLPPSNSKTRLSKLNQYGKETRMDEEMTHIIPATTNLSLTAHIPATTPVPNLKKPKPLIDIKSRKQSCLENQQKQKDELMINNKKNRLAESQINEDFACLRVESPHKLGKAAGDGYKFIASSSVQINSTSNFKNTNKQNQFDSFQSNFYENNSKT